MLNMRTRMVAAGMAALVAATVSPTPFADGEGRKHADAALRRYQASLLDPQAGEGNGARWPSLHDRHHTPTNQEVVVAAPLEPERGGSWSYATPFENRFNAIHTIAGPGGKILAVAGSGNDRDNFEAGTFRTFLWNTVTGARTEIPTPTDFFCAGHVLLPDGRALVGGGTIAYYPFKGRRTLYAFDFVQERYERLTDMEIGRWYPSLVNDWRGRTVIAGGLDESGTNTPVTELFNYRLDRLETLPSRRTFPLYPQIHLATGRRFFVAKRSDGADPGFWNPFERDGFVPVPGFTNASQRIGAASCFVGDARDQRFMIMGGGWPATTSTNIISLHDPAPAYLSGPPLRTAKAYVSCINLPEGTLLEAHGGTANDIAAASREVARLSADRRRWIRLNPLPAGEHRLYHSMLFLLDDGRVASLTSNPDGGVFSTTLLIYRPPYLFSGRRPTITRAPANVTYGGTYRFGATTPGSTLTRITLTSPPSPTHSVEPNQRYVSLDVVDGRVRIPVNTSILPPGKYRAWAVNDRSVPSVAHWITVS